MSKKAVVLLSGGLDSTTCLAIAKSEGYRCYPLSFDYSQKQRYELKCAKRIVQLLGTEEHRIMRLPIDDFKAATSMTDPTMPIPDYVGDGKIPNTYVPARNTIFLSFALAYAELVGAEDIFIGANQHDYVGYPDCRLEYLRAFEAMAVLATKAGVEGGRLQIHAPLLMLTKKEIIKKGIELGIDYGTTLSCYRPDDNGHSCGTCDSCTYRKKGFAEAGIADPTVYF